MPHHFHANDGEEGALSVSSSALTGGGITMLTAGWMFKKAMLLTDGPNKINMLHSTG